MKPRLLLILHRRMGLISALFVMLLSLTGLILHYSTGLRLDSSFIDSPALVDWYGIEVPDITVNYQAGGSHLAQLDNSLFLNARPIPGNFAELQGLVTTDFGFAAATADQIILLTGAGELVEVLGSVHGVPAPIEAIGSTASGQVYLQALGETVLADLDALQWLPRPGVPAGITWQQPEPSPPALREQIRAGYTGSLISWERLLLDIHSGRILGGIGVILVDLMAILFLLMALTGIWIWSKRRP